ncbi:MAG TPA: class I SAM-dependent methyltransferase [Actinomycetota bacterium]|jgi:ubiquinone/menaquinone biosynthesis C-methylase UbiE
MDDRYSREQSFHDHAYTEHTRAGAGKFYTIQGKSREHYKRLLATHALAGARVLEYGCGRGSSALFLAENGAIVSAIDISEAGLDLARKEARHRGVSIDFRLMNAEKLEFPEETFDLVCGSAILHHLDLDRSFREVSKVLKPGGAAVFIEPLGHNPLINLYRRLTPRMRTEDEHPLRMQDFAVARRYFHRVHVEFYHLFSLAAVPLRNRSAFPRIVGMLDALDAAFFRRWSSMRKYAWYVVMMLTQPRGASRRPNVIGCHGPG